ncbi:hypothetical protein BDV96DRAFT_602083 [Lophiotrema nucula]|uniref:Uncharacterized protein n=1 Tax=Lophiotrema nucula TaxID=690887 RepID=A0A6A5Z0T4_9PLEO|nr:hypothetical protein BDV96DRAFT_602083 [Lophiotrema nucula]
MQPNLTIAFICVMVSNAYGLATSLASGDAAFEAFKVQKKALPREPLGQFHLADDGVLRSLAANYTVLGYIKLSPELIATHIEHVAGGLMSAAEKDHYDAVFDGVDGLLVEDDDQLWATSAPFNTLVHPSPENQQKRGPAACKVFEIETSPAVARDAAAVTPAKGSILEKRADCFTRGNVCGFPASTYVFIQPLYSLGNLGSSSSDTEAGGWLNWVTYETKGEQKLSVC